MGKRLIYEEVKKIFEDEGCELLENEYKRADQKLKYKCSCENISYIRLSEFKRGHRCKECGKKKLNNKFKLTYEEVYKYFLEQNCELLEKEYKNNQTSMEYRCICGETSKITFGHFKNGRRCKKCGRKKQIEKRKLTYKYVYNYFKEQGCELLEKEYKNNNILLKYKCVCEEISYITFGSFQQGHRCKKCKNKELRKKNQFTFEYVYNYFLEQKCELLSKEYFNCNIKMEYRCSCGNISYINFNNFKQGRRCMKCSGKEKFTYKYVYNYFKKKGCELLEEKYINSRTKIKYRCVCKETSYITFDSFKQGHRCRKCAIKKNSGKNSSCYNPNLTDEERILNRDYPEYKKWVKTILKKDNYTCQCCFKRGCSLNAHHIESYDVNIDLRLDENNGITFCKDCHKEFHKIYGYGHNTREQLNEFLGILVSV